MKYNHLNLTGSSAPHIRVGCGTWQIMLTVIIALLPALGFAVYRFGPRPAVNVLLSAAACCLLELVFRLARRQDMTVGDLSAVVTGMLLALSCPADIPYWLLLAGDLAAAAVKQLFGGIGRNWLNPALTARALLLLWNGGMTSVDAVTSPTPLALLRANNLPGLRELGTLPELFVGLSNGAAGELSTLLLLAGGLYLIARRVISWRIPAAYLGTAAALTFLLAWGNNRTEWMLYELCSGGMVLAAFFMATDPVTSPISPAGQLLYGVGCGLLTILLHYFGFSNEGVCIAVLLMNLAGRPLDEYFLTGRVEKPKLPRLPEKKKKT